MNLRLVMFTVLAVGTAGGNAFAQVVAEEGQDVRRDALGAIVPARPGIQSGGAVAPAAALGLGPLVGIVQPTADAIEDRLAQLLLGGFGTPGTVPLWATGHKLGDSVVVQGDGEGSVGNVGIGTSDPSADLHVRGNLSKQLSGTVTTNGSDVVVGDSSTLFLDELNVDDSISIDGNVRTVESIDSQSLLTVDSALPAGSGLSAHVDSDLLRIQDGAGADRLLLDRQGRLEVTALVGVTNGSEAMPGEVGEVVSDAKASVPAPSPGGTDLGSITLSPGDWDIRASALFNFQSANYVQLILTAPGQPSVPGETVTRWPLELQTGSGYISTRANIATTTTFTLVADQEGQQQGSGSVSYSLRARRMR
jgi:hypothetical protein